MVSPVGLPATIWDGRVNGSGSRPRLSPVTDQDDSPFAGGIGHGRLGQVPGHRGHDRADPAQLTWLAGQAGQRAPRHAEFGSPLQQFANRLITQRSEVQPGKFAQ